MFFTQITMEAAEDTEFLDAMRRAHIRGALVGVEAVTPEGLKDVYKGFNLAGDALAARLQTFRKHGVHVLGSFIFGLPSDKKDTFDATVALAEKADLTFAQFVLLTPFPGTLDFEKWAKDTKNSDTKVDGVPITQHWLIPEPRRPKLYTAHPTMSLEEIRVGTQGAWDQFYSLPQRLGARLEVGEVDQGSPRLRADLEALSPDVREHRDCDRQRARAAVGEDGAVARAGRQAAVPRLADAEPADAATSRDSASKTAAGELGSRVSGTEF